MSGDTTSNSEIMRAVLELKHDVKGLVTKEYFELAERGRDRELEEIRKDHDDLAKKVAEADKERAAFKRAIGIALAVPAIMLLINLYLLSQGVRV